MAGLPLLTNPFILAAVALLLGDPAVFLFVRSRKPSLTRLRRKTLLTANEAEFFRRLQRALPGFHVFPQVRNKVMFGLWSTCEFRQGEVALRLDLSVRQ